MLFVISSALCFRSCVVCGLNSVLRLAAPLLTTFLGIGIQSKHSQFELCLICIDLIKFLISGNLVVAMVIVVVTMAIMAVAMMISSIR